MSLTSKAKAWSLTHVISLIVLAVTDITYNALFFYYVRPISTLGILWNTFTNFGYALGMYYYVTKVILSAQGLQETTSTNATT